MKTVGALIIVILAIGLMTSGVAVYAIVGSNDSVDAREGNIKISSAAGSFPRPDYDSGWVAVSPGRSVQVEHNLGGKPDDYVIDMQSRVALGLSITNHGCGEDTYYVDRVQRKGYYYDNLTSQHIYLVRSNDDVSAQLLRVRIWVCSAAAGCAADFAQYGPLDEGFSPSTIRAGQILYLTFGGANEGTEAIAPGWRIRYFACRTDQVHLYDGDYALYETTADFGISPGTQHRFTEAFTFPTKDLHGRTISPGQYYIGWYFDPDDEVCESDDDNNAGCITGAKITVVSP